MALFRRERTGQGDHVDVSLYEPLMFIVGDMIMNFTGTGYVQGRVGNGTGELIVLLTTILDPTGSDGARADELAAAYHQRWEEETANDQLKTHLRGPGRVLRSRLPDLVHQEIWAYLIVHHAISALTAKASAAADLDPDRISFAQALRLIRRTATGTADIPPCGLG